MEICCLGTGGYHPNDRRETACYLFPEQGIVWDAGTAAYRLASTSQTNSLDIFLTHAHWDHIIGLTYLLVPMASRRFSHVRVYGTQKTLDAVRNLLFAEPTFPVLPAFEFLPIDDKRVLDLEEGTMTWQDLPSHPGGSIAYCWKSSGNRIAYITDTSVDGSYTDFIRGADLLLHECYFPDERRELAEQTGHSVTADVINLAREANVKRLVMIHIDPQIDRDNPINLNGSAMDEILVTVAEDRQVISIT